MKTEKALTKQENQNIPLNRILLIDNINLLKSLPEKSVNFAYVDGPYYTQRNWGNFCDVFKSLDHYREFMKARLNLCKKVMKDNASICLHADYRTVHYLKVDMDNIFGYDNLINELIWDRNNKGGYRSRNRFIRTHETVLVYSNSKNYIFNMQYEPLNSKRMAQFRHDDNDGRGKYKWTYAADYKSIKDLEEGLKSGKYKWPESSRCPYYKKYLNTHKGTPPGTVINGISTAASTNRHGCAYEKPEKLSELLIRSFTNPGDLVLDLFCGTGTACVAAKRLSRNFIGCEIDPEMVKIANRRLKEV
jgi:site-specific DNA-methyltransferase (adenine-specific)